MVNKLLEGPEARDAILAKMREIGNVPFHQAKWKLQEAGFRIRPNVYGIYRKRLWPHDTLAPETYPSGPNGSIADQVCPATPTHAGSKPRGRPRKDGTPPGSQRPGMVKVLSPESFTTPAEPVTVAFGKFDGYETGPNRGGDGFKVPVVKVPISQLMAPPAKAPVSMSLQVVTPAEHQKIHQNQLPQAMAKQLSVDEIKEQLVEAGWTPPEPEPPQVTKDALALIQRFKDLAEECGGQDEFWEMAWFILGDEDA